MGKHLRGPPQFNSAHPDTTHWYHFDALIQHTASQCYTLDDVINTLDMVVLRYNLNIDLQEYFHEYPRYDFIVFIFLLLVFVLLISRPIWLFLLKLLTVFCMKLLQFYAYSFLQCIKLLQWVVRKFKCQAAGQARGQATGQTPLESEKSKNPGIFHDVYKKMLKLLSYLLHTTACIAEVRTAATMYMIVISMIQTCCLHRFKLYLVWFFVCNVHIMCNPSILDRGCLWLFVASTLSFLFEYDNFLSPSILCGLLGAFGYYRVLESIYDQWIINYLISILDKILRKYGVSINGVK